MISFDISRNLRFKNKIICKVRTHNKIIEMMKNGVSLKILSEMFEPVELIDVGYTLKDLKDVYCEWQLTSLGISLKDYRDTGYDVDSIIESLKRY